MFNILKNNNNGNYYYKRQNNEFEILLETDTPMSPIKRKNMNCHKYIKH